MPGLSSAESKFGYSQSWIEKSAEFLRESNWKAAIGAATKSITENPRYDLAYVLRAWAYIESGQIESALSDVNFADRSCPPWVTEVGEDAVSW